MQSYGNHPLYTIHYAHGSDVCEGPQPCKGSTIEANVLQFGTWWGRCPSGPKYVWRHFSCVTPTVLQNAHKKIDSQIEALDGFLNLSFEDQQWVRDTWDAGRPSGLSKLTAAQIKELLSCCGLPKRGDRGMLLASLTGFFDDNGLSLEGGLEDIRLRLLGFAALRAMAPPQAGPAGRSTVANNMSAVGQGPEDEDEKPAKKARRAAASGSRAPRATEKVSVKVEQPFNFALADFGAAPYIGTGPYDQGPSPDQRPSSSRSHLSTPPSSSKRKWSQPPSSLSSNRGGPPPVSGWSESSPISPTHYTFDPMLSSGSRPVAPRNFGSGAVGGRW